jgi:hypothetical protein
MRSWPSGRRFGAASEIGPEFLYEYDAVLNDSLMSFSLYEPA